MSTGAVAERASVLAARRRARSSQMSTYGTPADTAARSGPSGWLPGPSRD
ncbi:hypothetical protein ACFV5E_37495 [Streptomyces chartreusis]